MRMGARAARTDVRDAAAVDDQRAGRQNAVRQHQRGA